MKINYEAYEIMEFMKMNYEIMKLMKISYEIDDIMKFIKIKINEKYGLTSGSK